MSFRIVNVSSFGILIVFSIFVNKLIDGYGLDTHNVAKRMDLESCIGEFFLILNNLLQVLYKYDEVL